MYINDGICASKSKDQSMTHRDVVVSDLGFMLNMSKSCLELQQVGKWLGFIIHLLNGNFHVPENKVESLNQPFRELIHLSDCQSKA